jgi:hypothetical protein
MASLRLANSEPAGIVRLTIHGASGEGPFSRPKPISLRLRGLKPVTPEVQSIQAVPAPAKV